MADINDFNNELDRLIKQFDLIRSSFEKTIDRQHYFSKEIEGYSDDVLKALKSLLISAENDFKDVIDDEISKRKKVLENSLNEEEKIRQDYIDNLKKVNADNQKKYEDLELEKLHLLHAAANEENTYVRNTLLLKAADIQRQQNMLDEQGRILDLRMRGEEDLADFEERKLKTEKIREEARSAFQELAKKQREARFKSVNDHIEDILTRGMKEFTSTFENGANRITDSYEKYASSLSASLNLTVNDISKLQRNIADNLNSEGLGKAISNLQVMVETAALSSAGYTNEQKLQQSATDIEIGQRLAPNVDFNSATVKNLVNALGPDFTHRFSAIQAAVQESAGSTAYIASGFSSLIDDLEPVFLNAQYSLDALQGASDVSSTLTAAIESGKIRPEDADRYRSLLIELMDPNRAYKSNNLAVKLAATSGNYDTLLQSGNPMDFLNEILKANQTFYGNFDMSGNSAEAKRGRSLAAGIAGDDTFSATWNPDSLVGVTPVYSSDLSSIYQNRLDKLESEDYTTRKEEINNAVENSPITQNLSTISQYYPKIASVLLPTIIKKIDDLPKRLAQYIARGYSGAGDNYSTKNYDIDDVDINSTTTSNRSTTLLQTLSKANTATPGMNKGGKFATTVQKASKAVGGRTGGLAIASYGAGIMGAMNIAANISEEGVKGTFGNDFSSGVESAMNLGGIGATIGTLIAPGIGTAIGAGVGGLVGAIGSLVRSTVESNELTRERNRLQEEENKFLSEAGVEKLSEFQAKSIVAQGGGTISTSKGMFEIATHATGLSRVPYDDYLALLHKDEAVVTANAANEYRRSNPNFWNSPYSKNYQQNNDEVVYSLKEQTKSIVDAIKGNDEKDLQSLTVNAPKQYMIKNASLA